MVCLPFATALLLSALARGAPTHVGANMVSTGDANEQSAAIDPARVQKRSLHGIDGISASTDFTASRRVENLVDTDVAPIQHIAAALVPVVADGDDGNEDGNNDRSEASASTTVQQEPEQECQFLVVTTVTIKEEVME